MIIICIKDVDNNDCEKIHYVHRTAGDEYIIIKQSVLYEWRKLVAVAVDLHMDRRLLRPAPSVMSVILSRIPAKISRDLWTIIIQQNNTNIFFLHNFRFRANL